MVSPVSTIIIVKIVLKVGSLRSPIILLLVKMITIFGERSNPVYSASSNDDASHLCNFCIPEMHHSNHFQSVTTDDLLQSIFCSTDLFQRAQSRARP